MTDDTRDAQRRGSQVRTICRFSGLPLAVIACGLGAAAPAAAAPFGYVASTAAPAAAPPFVYVANHGSEDVSQFAAPLSRMEALTPLTPATVATGRYPEAMAVSPDGHSAYIANVDNNTIGQYTINPATGTLTPKSPATVPTGRGANGIAVSPDGNSAYVADATGNKVWQYTVNLATGTLTPKSPAIVAAGRGAAAIAVSPDGNSAYVVNGGDGTISQYNIDPATGTLTPKSPATVPTGRGANAIAVSPDGKNAYVAEPLAGAVWTSFANCWNGMCVPIWPLPSTASRSARPTTPFRRSPRCPARCWRSSPRAASVSRWGTGSTSTALASTASPRSTSR